MPSACVNKWFKVVFCFVSPAVPSGSGHEKDGSKSRGKLALSGKVVYLDVKDLRQAHSIQTKLKKLGAVSLLSEEITACGHHPVCDFGTEFESLRSAGFAYSTSTCILTEFTKAWMMKEKNTCFLFFITLAFFIFFIFHCSVAFRLLPITLHNKLESVSVINVKQF